MIQTHSIWLSRYTKLLSLVTFLLVIAGGLVTSTKSGLSVPDWPLSYGQWMPPMVGGVRYEHTHRMIAALVGLLTLILAVWLGFAEKRRWVRWLGIGALAMVAAQGILGGMTVLFLLPAPISVLHACLAQTFFAVVICVAYVSSKEWFGGEHASSNEFLTLKKTLWLTVGLIYSQLILGATVRHTIDRTVLLSHVGGAFILIFQVMTTAGFIFRNFAHDKRLLYPGAFLGLLAVAQISLGIGSFICTLILPERILPSMGKLFFVTAHQSVGALLLGVVAFLLLRIYRTERVIL